MFECYYAFIITLDKCNGSWNASKEKYGLICVPNKTEEL